VRNGKTYQREIWIAHQGQSVLRDSGLPDSSGRPTDTPSVIEASGLFPAGATSLTWDQLYALPTDPSRLKAVLESKVKDAGPDPTSELFTAVGDLLRESPASPALREALYDVAAQSPGVRVTGQVTDAAGRTGTGVSRGAETYVIDQSNGQLLADNADGWSSTYVSQGPVDGAPALSTK
jgi:hypothetical protein